MANEKQFGHWEIDLVLPMKQNNGQYQDHSAIMTVVERKTRFYALIKVKSKQSKDMIEALNYFMNVMVKR